MTRDEWVMAAVVLAFAAWVTTHVTLVAGLLRRTPRWRAAVAAVVVPLAPLWGWRAKMRVRSLLWIASALAYAFARWRAYR